MVATEVEQLAGWLGSGSGELVFHSTMRWCVCVQGGPQTSEQSPVVLPHQVLEEEVHQTQEKGAVPGKDSRQ